MQEFLNLVSYAKFPEFRDRAKKECGWTTQMFNFRVQGRTKLSEAERTVLRNIVNTL